MSLPGRSFLASLSKTAGPTREDAILAQLYTSVPTHLRKEKWLPLVLREGDRTLIIRVSPDVVSVGTDADYVRIPMWPGSAQRYANYVGAILPSRKLSKAIHDAAQIKLAPKARTPDATMESTDAFVAHDNTIVEQLATQKYSTDMLLSGHKKDVVIGPALDGKKVAIYGWHQANGQPIQPYSTIHDASYSDYSHGIRLVDREARLDGVKVDLMDVFNDSKNHSLVSDQGPFVPLFPNHGSNVERPPSLFEKTAFRSTESAPSNPLLTAAPTLIALGLVWATLNSVGRK